MVRVSWCVKRLCCIVILFFFIFLKGSVVLAVQPGSNVTLSEMDLSHILSSTESCEECHKRTTPRIYAEHMEGAHGREGVGCVDCHGSDHRAMPKVTAKSGCQQCHPDETAHYLASDHSRSWENMLESARYMKQPEVVRRQGCEACHRIGYGEDDGRCDFCHTKHSFSKAEAAASESCYTCHMGPDHPQMEAYKKSGHHGTEASCASCHLPGTHDVNRNLDRLSPDYMGALCDECHSSSFNRQWLDGARMLEERGTLLLEEGRRIIKELDEKKLLYPDPRDRAPNPVEGNILLLGGHQLYEDTSRAEKLYFEMHKYLQIHLAQGAYHQDFKMAAYEGLLPLQSYLAELQAEALFLREISGRQKNLTPITSFIQERPAEDLYQKTYESSSHGTLPDDRKKPDCKTCHKQDRPGTLESGELIELCASCHTRTQADIFVRDYDAIKVHAAGLIAEGRRIVEELLAEGVVQDEGGKRVSLKTVFKEDSTRAVAQTLVDRMNHYLGDLDKSLKIMVLGVAHTNPDYAHWYGNAPAKSDLIEIRDAAHKLEQLASIYGKRNPSVIWILLAGAGLLVVFLGIIGLNRKLRQENDAP